MLSKNSDAKDEMNLAEFPLCALAHRLNPEVKTLRFEDRTWDKGRNQWITRQLTVTGSDAYGLPTEKDDEILLGLIQLTRLQGFAERKVPFTRHELIRMLGWRDDSKSYARVEESLNRWTGVTLFYNKAWWNKERKCWMDEKFHILDNVWLCHRGDPPPDTGLPTTGAPVSAFVWNETIFRSFSAGNLKSIDFEFFKSLKSAVAKRLYRFLDKRFWHTHRHEFNLRELACEHIGLSRNYDTANLKRKLLSGIHELEAQGFLRTLPVSQRFTKVRRGDWTVLFQSCDDRNYPSEKETPVETHPLVTTLVERGVAQKTAKQFINNLPVDRIELQTRVFDWLVQNKNEKISRNPAGYLVSSIKNNYAVPKDFKDIKNSEPSLKLCCSTDISFRPNPESSKLEQKNRASRLAMESAIAIFWSSLSDEKKLVAETKAFSEARKLERDLLRRGGTFAAAARQNILDAFAMKQLERN